MRIAGAVGALVFAAAGNAGAEIQLVTPPPRSTDQAIGPCGSSTRSAMRTPLVAGERLVIEWLETVDRPGHFRIALDPGGNDAFIDPKTLEDGFPTTLVENVADMAGGRYRIDIPLPPVVCASCTLQVVQVMNPEPPYDAFSYQCADVELVDPGDVCGGAPAATMCCSAGAGGASTSAGLAVLGLVLRRQRRSVSRASSRRIRSSPNSNVSST